MTDRPIIFSGPMVRALLAGTKTQTRRVLKPQPKRGFKPWQDTDGSWLQSGYGERGDDFFDVPYAPGDRLYVREAFYETDKFSRHGLLGHERKPAVYRADLPADEWRRAVWKPSIHMPRWASRITLVVTDVKVERVADITKEDAQAEGMPEPYLGDGDPPFEEQAVTVSRRMQFRNLWNELNAKRGYGWDANPWVAAVSFEVHAKNIDEMPS